MRSLFSIIEISKYTFIEFLYTKVFLNVFFLGIFLLIISYIGAEFTYAVPSKIVLDFSLGIINISAIIIAIFMGPTLISKEIENRTLYMVLSKPVDRWAFLIGRFLGFSLVLICNIFLLGFWSALIYNFFDGRYSYLLPWSILFIFLESIFVLGIVLFFTLISNSMIAIFSTFTLYLIGHSIEAVRETSIVKLNSSLTILLKYYSIYFPNFTKLNIKNYVLYESYIDPLFLGSTIIYTLLYLFLILFINCIIFSKKELL